MSVIRQISVPSGVPPEGNGGGMTDRGQLAGGRTRQLQTGRIQPIYLSEIIVHGVFFGEQFPLRRAR